MTSSTEERAELLQPSAIDVNDVDGAGVVMLGLVSRAVKAQKPARSEDREAALSNHGSNASQVLVLRDYCLRPWGSACTRCEMLCPSQAIVLADHGVPTIDTALCNRCGVCAGVCDAFVVCGAALSELYARLRSVALHWGYVIVTCESCLVSDKRPTESVVVVPSLALLSAEFLACLLAEGTVISIAGSLEMLFSEVHGGQTAEILFDEALSLAEIWSGRRIGYLETVPYDADYVQKASQEEKSRREYFDDFMAAMRTGNVSSEPSVRQQESTEQQWRRSKRSLLRGFDVPKINTYMPGNRLKQILWPKRRLLLEAFVSEPIMEDMVALLMSGTDTESCIDCLQCVGACPTKARYAHGEDGLLEFDGRYCIGCGLCEHVCPTHAIALYLTNPLS